MWKCYGCRGESLRYTSAEQARLCLGVGLERINILRMLETCDKLDMSSL